MINKILIIAIIVLAILIVGILLVVFVFNDSDSDSGSDSEVPIVCSCTEDLNCGDFTTQAEAQACFEHCGPEDVHRLDADKNGVVCESLV